MAAEYAAARDAGNFDVAAVFAGEGVGLIHDIPPAAEIVDRIVAEAEQILQGRRNFLITSARVNTRQCKRATTMWPDRRIIDLFKTEFPIVLAPMAGVMDADLVIAAAQGGALGSLPCAMLSVEKAREQVNIIRQRVSAPVNMNFFCHKPVDADPAREAGWKKRLAPYYQELGLDPAAPVNAANRAPFDAAMCELVEELKPEVVSFHFGLPEQALLKRVKAAGCIVIASATIVREAIWLEENGADAIIAQGAEAGGHRGMFLTENIAEQPGTFALVPQVVDAVKVPVIAAGGIADGRGIAAAFALGAAGVQIGTAYLRCPESKVIAPAPCRAWRRRGTIPPSSPMS